MRVVAFLFLLLAMAWLLTGVTQVQPGERAVVRRFGRVLEDKPGPGLHLGLPWGIDQVDRVLIERERNVKIGYEPEVEESAFQTPPGQLLTGDHNLVNLQVILDYAVNEDEVVDFVLNGERTESLIARAGEAALAEWVAGHNVDAVLLDGKRLLPGWLVERTQEHLTRYRLGVRVVAASVTHLFPPDDVRRAFDDVTAAQTRIRTETHEAQQAANTRWLKEKATEQRIKNETKAYVREQSLKAEADATTFNARVDLYHRLSKENPGYLNALWWEEMSKLYASMREGGRIDLLDNRLGADGLDITQFPLAPAKK